MVELVTDIEPVPSMPPLLVPLLVDVLKEMVELTTVKELEVFMPPPSSAALPEMSALDTVNVPEFSMPPPSRLVVPPVIVIPLRLTLKLPLILNTRLALLPETVSRFAPGPWIVRFLLTGSSVPPSVIVCGVLKSDEKPVSYTHLTLPTKRIV